MGFVAAPPQPFAISSSNVFKNRDATSKYCKLKSKYFIQRTENCKKFRINCIKDAI